MAEQRFVDVAVDAPGVPGGRSFTYVVPDALADIELGEAVMVEFGRRRAVGLVLDEAAEPGMEAKPLLARVRSDGPLLGELARRLARDIAEHYLAPPGLVVRAMLPPGLLERIELFVESEACAEGESASSDPLVTRVREAGLGGMRVDDLPPASSRATLLRSLRGLEEAGALRLEWRLLPPTARPRQQRWASLTAAGAEAAGRLAEGDRPDGRPLGPRQRALLAEMGRGGRLDSPPRGWPNDSEHQP